MMETLLGGVFGGLLRLAPEALKFFDQKNERKHELAMAWVTSSKNAEENNVKS